MFDAARKSRTTVLALQCVAIKYHFFEVCPCLSAFPSNCRLFHSAQSLIKLNTIKTISIFDRIRVSLSRTRHMWNHLSMKSIYTHGTRHIADVGLNDIILTLPMYETKRNNWKHQRAQNAFKIRKKKKKKKIVYVYFIGRTVRLAC